MTYQQKRCEIAYRDADPKPDLITLSRDDWHLMFEGYSKTVRDLYVSLGFYHIEHRKRFTHTRRKEVGPGVPAFTYKGIPVVIREDYDEMMRGHRSKRIVLAV